MGVGGGMPPRITSIINGLAPTLHNAPYRTIAKAMSAKALILFTYSGRNASLSCVNSTNAPGDFPAAPPIFYQMVKKNRRSRLCRIPPGNFETTWNKRSLFLSFRGILFSFINTGHCRFRCQHGLQFKF